MNYPPHLADKLTWAGNVKNPIAIDTYKNLYSNLDEEFYLILSMFSWYKSGLISLNVEKLPYKIALGLKYLVDLEEVEKRSFLIG